MVKRVLTHALFAPALLVAIFGLGAATLGFLVLAPTFWTSPWIDTLLVACFGWNAETRHFRLDALILILLQPPLFAGVVYFCYRDECRAFLESRSRRGLALGAPFAFVALAALLLATREISASGTNATPGALPYAFRQGSAAPEFRLTDHRGLPVSLANFRGQTVVMTFVYANCHASCPILIERLKSIERRYPTQQIAFLAVTLDPEQDTPATLAAAAANWALGDRWHLLTGTPNAVRALVRAHRVQSAPLPNGEIAHENAIVLIDRRGRLAYTYRGLAYPEERRAADLGRLLGERG